jgi:hypothetical protein
MTAEKCSQRAAANLLLGVPSLGVCRVASSTKAARPVVSNNSHDPTLTLARVFNAIEHCVWDNLDWRWPEQERETSLSGLLIMH